MRNKEIAYQIGTTEQVIKNYLRKVYDKLGVSDRLELALYCLHHQILKTDPDEPLPGPLRAKVTPSRPPLEVAIRARPGTMFLAPFRRLTTSSQRHAFAPASGAGRSMPSTSSSSPICLKAIAATFHVDIKRSPRPSSGPSSCARSALLLFGYLAERYGRRPTLMTSSSASPSLNRLGLRSYLRIFLFMPRAVRHRHGR